jgi:hypothetical protein
MCCWKALDEGYNFGLDLVSIGGLHTKLWGTKVVGVPTLAILGFPFGNLWTKNHLDEGLTKRCRLYYMGEGDGFLRVRGCLWLFLAPKVLQLCTNHFVLVLCRSVKLIEACQFFLVPFRSSSTPLYLFKVLRVRERASSS